jgi:uncharacterized alkaline shock family protein YloU
MTASNRTSSTDPRADAGEVIIADVVIAKLAGRAARTTYGVVAMRRSPVRRVAGLFRHPLTEGVSVEMRDGAAHIVLHVVMERGVNLAQVTVTLQEQVRYEVEHRSGVPVTDVVVRVEDLRE